MRNLYLVSRQKCTLLFQMGMPNELHMDMMGQTLTQQPLSAHGLPFDMMPPVSQAMIPDVPLDMMSQHLHQAAVAAAAAAAAGQPPPQTYSTVHAGEDFAHAARDR